MWHIYKIEVLDNLMEASVREAGKRGSLEKKMKSIVVNEFLFWNIWICSLGKLHLIFILVIPVLLGTIQD